MCSVVDGSGKHLWEDGNFAGSMEGGKNWEDIYGACEYIGGNESWVYIDAFYVDSWRGSVLHLHLDRSLDS
jgi:hypothetical protein